MGLNLQKLQRFFRIRRSEQKQRQILASADTYSMQIFFIRKR